MAESRSKLAFSLIELIIVIALIAIFASVSTWYVYGVLKASKVTIDNQNVQLWNTVYSNTIAAQPEFADLDWSDASGQLAAGVQIAIGGTVFTMKADKPAFANDADPVFEKGKGIISAPARGD